MSRLDEVSLRRRLSKFVYFLALGHSPAKARWLARHDAPRFLGYRDVACGQLQIAWETTNEWSDLAITDGRISSRALGLPIDRDEPSAQGYTVWRALRQRGWSFRQENGRLLAAGAGLTLPVTTREECDMMREIFLHGVYDWRLPGRWRVADIGGNVAFAALFFATRPWVERVVSFEPFAPTAAVFAQNLALNPEPAAKIALHRVGLGDQAGRHGVAYHPHLRGSMSVHGLGSWRRESGPIDTVEIEIERASDALAPLWRETGSPLLAKLDCEGSEYAILRNLESAGALAAFDAFVIEWHGRGPGELVEILMRAGFALHVQPLSSDEATLGLIHALRPAPAIH